MDTKILMKEVYQKAKTGQFAEVLELIKGVDIIKEVALNILVCASNACYNSQKESSNINNIEVYNLLNNIVRSIDTLNDTQLITFLRSIFHIIKYMCEKEWFGDLTKMEIIIIPTFLKKCPLKSTEEARRVYQAMVNKLCNSIFDLAEAKKTIYNKYLLRLIELILKANNQINTMKDALSIAHKFLNIIQDLKFQNNELCEFYFMILDCFASDIKKNEDCKDSIQLLIHLFSIIISQIIKSKEFQVSEMFLVNVESRITSLNFSLQGFLQSHLLFRAITAVFPNANKIQHNIKKCQVDINVFNNCQRELLIFIIRCLEEPFYELLSYYKSSGCKNWCGLPCDTILDILRFLKGDIFCHLVLASTKCSCGCSMEKNYCGTLKIGCQILGLLKQYINSNKNASKLFYSELLQWLSYFYEILKNVKTHECKKCSQIYRELGTYAYNIGTALYRQENVAFLNIYQCFLKYSIEFEGSSPELLKPSLNEVTINVMCELELKNQNVEMCMAFAALYCLLYPTKGNCVIQNWWIRSKMKVKEDSTIQQQTLVSILEKHPLALSCIINPKNKLNKEKKLELLTYELLRYKTVWKSKESIMAAFSHLNMIAEVPTIARVILEIFGDGEIQLHESMPAILSRVMKKLQEFCRTNSDGYPKMAMAVLNYYIYKNSSKEMADENLEEMERTMQVIESTKEKFEPIPKDPNDECDIVSAYSNLRLSKFTETFRPLNKCLESMSSCPIQSFEPQIIKNIVKLLINIGFDYRLHCFSIKCIQAFELALKFAQVISDKASQLLALSFLIENADTNRNVVKEMISQADELTKLLDKDNINHSKTIAIYHISKAKAYLYDDEYLSLKSWKIADALVTVNEEKNELKFLRAELHILRYKLTKSCSVVAGEHERHPMTFKLHCAMDIVINLSKNILSSYELCIMFDTVYELAKVYYQMRLPRDLRAYSKNSVLLTQKTVLPIRCVSFLILLARSDLLTCKFDHCNVKLNGVNDIFCLSQSRPVLLNERIDSIEADTKAFENEVDICAGQIQEIALDLPQHTKQYSPSSPALVVQSFKVPQFLSHEKSCICFICISFEYHQLLLQKYHLDALYNMYDKDEKMAEEFIHGALRLYKTLKRNYDCYKEKAKSLISESLIPSFDDSFREYYGSILYDYSFHLKRQALASDALKINTELVQLLKPKKFQYVYLYNDALLQRLSYIITEPKQTSREMEISAQLKSLSLTPNEYISLQKTPTSKKSTVTVTINGRSQYSPPKRRVRKKCALFTSPSDTEDVNKKETAQAAVTLKTKTSKKSDSDSTNTFALPKPKAKRNISAFSTPLLGDPRTPKISIFTDDQPTGSVRKSCKKQPISMKKLVPVETPEGIEFSSSPVAQKSTKKVRKILTSTMIADDNGHSSKENSVDGNSQQLPIIAGPSKTRSQLLTQKIKASTIQSKTYAHKSTNLRKKIADELLVDKMAIPIKNEQVSSGSKTEGSSIILDSPEHEVSNTKSIAALEKARVSAKKISQKKCKVEPEAKKNLLSEFMDTGSSSSKCTKYTGPIRKSTRNRVL